MIAEPREDATDRLDLDRPRLDDVDELFELLSDPRVWTHFPSLRHTSPDTTRTAVERWIGSWRRDGLGPWVVRERGSERLAGCGGCSLLGGAVWNLGYRFTVDAQGRGFATEMSRQALARARSTEPRRPIVAYLLEHNKASAAVARKLGMELQWRGPDAGNPDPYAVRLVYADGPLSAEELAATRA